MNIYLIIIIVVALAAAISAYFIGKKVGKSELNSQLSALISDRDVQRANAENAMNKIAEQKALADEQKVSFEKQIWTIKADFVTEKKTLKDNYDKQLEDMRKSMNDQLTALREMNRQQMEDQMALLKEQMQTTSENVLKSRQAELDKSNTENVSKIVDPLRQSLKNMQEALDNAKQQQTEAFTRLDESIKSNMAKSASLGETADRLTRALTGEVKVQGNFGELKLKQLLEDMELQEGEQFDTQETLRDKGGKSAKGDDGKGLIPDFILHFPGNRHVVVDSKMSLTDYERYMNAEDDSDEKSAFLKAHIESVRMQVKRLARKEYTRYLPDGYNKLNFAIMYIPIEGALNLALLNDSTLWKEAYDQGVMILGPQTMYMNLRVLEMMWTQVKQLKNQQQMVDAANLIVERVQDFGKRFQEVESSMQTTINKMSSLKTTTADSGPSIITAARNLVKAGAKESAKKPPLASFEDSFLIETDEQI